jgi:hypothetical protein
MRTQARGIDLGQLSSGAWNLRGRGGLLHSWQESEFLGQHGLDDIRRVAGTGMVVADTCRRGFRVISYPSR